MTEKEMEKRILKLEKKNEDLEKQISRLAGLVLSIGKKVLNLNKIKEIPENECFTCADF